MSKLLAFRPKSYEMVDFLLLALAAAMRKHGPIKVSNKELQSLWRMNKVTWSYLSDGSIKFELDEIRKQVVP